MKKLSNELIFELEKLSNKNLIKIITRFAKKYSEINDILEYELVKSNSEKDLYNQVIDYIETELYYSGRGIIQKEITKKISNCVKKINNFSKLTKSKYYEALGLQYLLKKVFEIFSKDFQTCWTAFDSKVTITAKRYFNLVISLHEDYYIEFKDDFENLLKQVKNKCKYIDSAYALPNSFDEYLKEKYKLK
jgi:hypothetical protein